jgi:hypothetical protein
MILFVGEKRSKSAIRMGVTWKDGRLAAKQLFDALERCGLSREECVFLNWFERGTKKAIRNHEGPRIAMGRKVQRALELAGIEFVPMVHPAARGAIRKKDRFACHVSHVLAEVKRGSDGSV